MDVRRRLELTQLSEVVSKLTEIITQNNPELLAPSEATAEESLSKIISVNSTEILIKSYPDSKIKE